MYVVWVSAIAHTSSVNVISKATSDSVVRILGDHQHPLQKGISKTRPLTSTRSRFELFPLKNGACRRSVLPALSRLLIDRNAELNYYTQEPSWCISFSLFSKCTTYPASNTLSLSTKKLTKLNKALTNLSRNSRTFLIGQNKRDVIKICLALFSWETF